MLLAFYRLSLLGLLASAEAIPSEELPAPCPARLQGVVRSAGRRLPLVAAEITFSQPDAPLQAGHSDASGRFSLPLCAGPGELTLRAAGYLPLVVHKEDWQTTGKETLFALEPDDSQEFRTEIRSRPLPGTSSRTSLQGQALRAVAGTLGDPFRAVGTLPGLSNVSSTLPYPLIRGTAPGSSGFLLDGAPLPMLYHLLIGTSVIHPEFIERIDFYPGTFPARYGGYLGGIIDGVSRRATALDNLAEASVDLLCAGAFVRHSFNKKLSATVSGRYGYPGLILSALALPMSVVYWDYQARLDASLGPARLSLFALGAEDRLYEKINKRAHLDVGSLFHRLEASASFQHEKFSHAYFFYIGTDQSLIASQQQNFISRWYMPKIRLTYQPHPAFGLQLGGEWLARTYNQSIPQLALTLTPQFEQWSTFLESVTTWPAGLTTTLGVRGEGYHNGAVQRFNVGPRLHARYSFYEDPEGSLALYGAAGQHAQPPRPALSFPALENLGLNQGLAKGWQSALGVDYRFAHSWQLDVQSFFNHLQPLIMDLGVNLRPQSAPPRGSQILPNTNPLLGLLNSFQTPAAGRAYGLEIFLRKHNRGPFYGWLSYTLSRSERYDAAYGWYVFDLNRTHQVQAVLGVNLPRHWQAGARLQVASGRPLADAVKINGRRGNPSYRLDVRIERQVYWSAVHMHWYVDIINTTAVAENLLPQLTLPPYVLPALGLKVRF